ncbi:MAG TPA: DUF4419 domain-containing protein [Candidatus Saccharimonadales bacterium]|nr:DUF4419 domain-containing protein [Candidatus Saccharimonadales bacterium]
MTVVIDTPVEPSYDRWSSHRTQEATRVEQTGNEVFLKSALGNPARFHYNSSDTTYFVNQPDDFGDYNEAAFGSASASLGIQAIHQAYASHTALSLRPEVLWYMIVHEVAQLIKDNSSDYARLFTDTPEAKQTIEVRDDSLRYDAPSEWGRAINLFRDPLREKITDYTADLFLPRFSTSTIEDETTLLIALMDAASPFYEYVMSTRCGIPRIQLEGEPTDWNDLYFRTEMLARDFHGLAGYFSDLLPVLQQIAETAGGATPNEGFWRSIYKYEDGSGGPHVSGWITAFFAYIQTKEGPQLKKEFDWRSFAKKGWGGYKTNQFSTHVSKVPFTWDYFGTKYPMAFGAGITNVGFEGSFLVPRLGFAVAEV